MDKLQNCNPLLSASQVAWLLGMIHHSLLRWDFDVLCWILGSRKFYNIISYNPWIKEIFPFISSIFKLFHQYFVFFFYLSVQAFHISWLNLYPHLLYFYVIINKVTVSIYMLLSSLLLQININHFLLIILYFVSCSIINMTTRFVPRTQTQFYILFLAILSTWQPNLCQGHKHK